MILHDVDGPVSVTDAASNAGRAQKYGPSEDVSLTAPLGELFRTERQRYEELLRRLREAVALPEIRNAWLRESLGPDQRTLELDVVTDVKAFGWIDPELRTRLAQTERRFDIIVELNAFTQADGPEMPQDALLLWGAWKDAGHGAAIRRAQPH